MFIEVNARKALRITTLEKKKDPTKSIVGSPAANGRRWEWKFAEWAKVNLKTVEVNC